MKAEEKKQLEEIRKKVEAGQELTMAEEFIYLTKVLGHTDIDARTVITTAENQDKNVLID